VATSQIHSHRFQSSQNFFLLSHNRYTSHHKPSLKHVQTHAQQPVSNNLDVNQKEKWTRCKSKNRWISAFEKIKLLPNLEEDLALRGGGQLLVIRSVAAGCKAWAGCKVAISHCWSVLGLDDFQVRESRLAQISWSKKSCQVQGISSEIGMLLLHHSFRSTVCCPAWADVDLVLITMSGSRLQERSFPSRKMT